MSYLDVKKIWQINSLTATLFFAVLSVASIDKCSYLPFQNQSTVTTNDIVINKLTQILSYLRQGVRANKKNKKKDRDSFLKGILTISWIRWSNHTRSTLPTTPEDHWYEFGRLAFSFLTLRTVSSMHKRKILYFSDSVPVIFQFATGTAQP